MDDSFLNNQNGVPKFLAGGGEMGQRIRDFDWSKTSLGPVDSWPRSLKTCVQIMLTSRQPIWLGWGKELIKLYNDPYKAIVGGKHPWALGEPASVVWKDIWHDIESLLTQVMQENEGTYVESQLLIMQRNGYAEETYYTFSYTPIAGDTGETEGMICFNTDDTDRIISERQLKTLTELGKSLTDPRSKEEVSQRTIDTLEKNPHDFPFSLLYELSDNQANLVHTTKFDASIEVVPKSINLSSSDEISTLCATALQQRKHQTVNDLQSKIGIMPRGAWQIPPDKVIILPIAQRGQKEAYGLLVVGMNPFRLLDEKYLGFFELITDQIATSHANINALEEERKHLESLAEVDRAKTTFFSNISHEFRTPLTLLLGPIEDLLNDEDVKGDNKQRADVAFRNALRMQKLVNLLLDFSRIEAGRMEANFIPVDIVSITKDLASNFRSAIEKAGMQLILNTKSIELPVYVDVDMWEKIMLNLLSNAFKYSEKGSIEVSILKRDSFVDVSVKDTGVGIPEDEIDKIFERFHRVQNSKGRSQEGTGIGLAMVKELVKLNGGTISVNSKVGIGSQFTVSLPLHKTNALLGNPLVKNIKTIQPQSSAYIEEALQWLPETAEVIDDTIPSINGKHYTVLLADDNADMRKYVHRLLMDDYSVIVANDGEEAFTKALQHTPDLILSDVMMPKLDGFGLLLKLKNNLSTRNIPVVFLSARAGEEAKVEGLKAGADDYLTKPFSSKELLARVGNHITISTARRKTEKEFYNLFIQSPAHIHVMKGPEHVLEFFHPLGIPFAGKDITGMKIREALPHLEGQGFFELLDNVYHNGVTVQIPTSKATFTDKSGKPVDHYFNITYLPWKDLEGNIQGILQFTFDVTEQVKATQKIQESEARFRLLATSIPQIVWTTDQQGQVNYITEQFEIYTGQTPEEAIRTWGSLVHPDDLEAVSIKWMESLKTGEPWLVEYRLKNIINGTYRWFSGNSQALKNDKGEITMWIGSATDIQNFKEQSSLLEEQVQERTRALKLSNEDLQQFAHVASHDLKEPIRKIKTYSNRLQDDFKQLLPEKGAAFINKIQSATDRMYSMIDGVLSYSTLASGDQPTEKVDLNEVLKNIQNDLEVLIQEKHATISYDALPTLEGAPVLLYQLFYNLINNSMKFTRPDVPPLITLHSSVEDIAGKLYAKIILTDNGIGFDQQYAESIFATFTRLNSKDKYEGTGLGLALCKKIVQRHDGFISAKGEKNKGAEFTVLLPKK